jgi:NTE family protein
MMAVMDCTTDTDPTAALLRGQLTALLGPLEPTVMARLLAALRRVHLASGETLITQGEPGDAMYLALTGRLRAYVTDADGSRRLVRDVRRGDIVGELSLYTDEPRAATVVAVRDALLVRLERADFAALVAQDAALAMALTRRVLQLMKAVPAALTPQRPATVSLLPISDGLAPGDFAARLRAALGPTRRVGLVDRAAYEAERGRAATEAATLPEAERISLWLGSLEAEHDLLLLVGDADPGGWTALCARHADERLLLADATRPPHRHAVEDAGLAAPHAEVAQLLVLLHSATARTPRGTRHWLEGRAVASHLHLRPTLERDMARLARILSREAVGLVLAGGGARGLAHLGVWQALHEHGIEVDMVGGTSIGAVMAAYVASDQPPAAVLSNARRAFRLNPTGDFNLLPLLSLLKGRRLLATIRRAVDELLGFDADLEDLWKGCFAITTNYSQASEQRLQRGNLVKALLSSIAIPGALPPVVQDGDLLCDGGSFNNFPVDVMRSLHGVGRVIGIDLEVATPGPAHPDELPSRWALLRDRLRPPDRRRHRLPSLTTYLMRVPTLYSRSRRLRSKALTDLYFNPPLAGVGLLAWERFEEIVGVGYGHGREVLGAGACPPTAGQPAQGPAVL